jgi:threonine aldolase
MDGVRFANALVALDAPPAEMSWKLGVDVLSFGATKNGAMTAYAIVSFDPALATELAYRHKRGGQLTSKMRFQTAQLDAYLSDDLWLNNALHANQMLSSVKAKRVARGHGTSRPGRSCRKGRTLPCSTFRRPAAKGSHGARLSHGTRTL